MQTKCRQEHDKKEQEELGAQLLSREQALSIFEQLHKLRIQIESNFKKDQNQAKDSSDAKMGG